MHRSRPLPFPLAALVAPLLLAAACAPTLLPETEIAETEETRAIYDVIVAYRAAMEKRDADAVLRLVGKDYFETGGTEDPADDYGYDQLAEHLRADLERSMVLRLDLSLKDIQIDGDLATVTYRYRSRAHVRFPAGDQWVTDSDINQMKLKREGERWQIVSGL